MIVYTDILAIFETVTDRSDLIPLCPRLHLFLKPSARILITVQLSDKSKTSISNWQVMERLKEWIDPDKFSKLCVAKSSVENVKFDAELADRSRLPTVLSRLYNRRIKFPGITYLLTVRATETKPDFPTRHDWDSYFRDSKDMNELNPGERPDTLHIENIPIDWLTEPGEKFPSENILKKIFNVFGEVARVDLPVTDPSRTNHGVGICDAYIQFRDYKAFAKAMDTLKGHKLVYITDTKALSANIKVDFDKTKHMSLDSITKRHERRDRFMMRKKAKKEEERIKKEREMKKNEEENKKKQFILEKRFERRKLREEKRKGIRLKRLADREANEMNQRIATEEKLLLLTQRKLEAMHLLGELFTRIKLKIVPKSSEEEKHRKNNNNTDLSVQFGDIESTFRQKMIEKWKPFQLKHIKNSINHNNNSENQNHKDQNSNNNRDHGQSNWPGNRGRGDHQYAVDRGTNHFQSPPLFDSKQLISYGHEYHKYIQKLNKKSEGDRSRSQSQNKKRRRSFSSTSSRSCSRSQSKSYCKSKSRSHSKSKNSKKNKNSPSRSKSVEKTTEKSSGRKHKKKDKKKKKKKHKKSKK